MKSKAVAFKLGHVRGNIVLTQWVVMVLKCNVLCHLQPCKCPDQDLWALVGDQERFRNSGAQALVCNDWQPNAWNLIAHEE